MQEFIATPSNLFCECIIMKKSRVNEKRIKKEQKGKGKEKKKNDEDEETRDDDVGERENNS